jgi:hypothetical protein
MKINTKISDIIQQYQKYDSYIKINNKKIDEIDINHIFDELNTYLTNIDINVNININIYIIEFIISNYRNNDDYLNKMKNDILSYIFYNIENYYKLIINNYKEKNYIAYYKIYEYDIILLLYSYYYYINLIFDFISYAEGITIDKIKEFIQDKTILIKLFNLTSIKSDLNITNKDIEKLYIFVINDFNKEILLSNDDYINKLSKNYIIKKIIKNNDIIHKKSDKFFNIIISHLIKFYKIHTIINNYENNYITIAQYVGNCWYIAILTCICYSDLSKKLIYKKLKKYDLLTKGDKNRINKIFIDTVKYIIENITWENKKYKDVSKEQQCIYEKFFKYDINKYLYEGFEDFIKYDYKQEPYRNWIYMKHHEFGGLNDFVFKNIYQDMINDNCINMTYYLLGNKDKFKLSNEKAKKCNIGIDALGYIIINRFYNMFNLNTLYLYDYKHDINNYYKQIYTEDDDPEKRLQSPDIIFIDKFEDIVIYNNIVKLIEGKVKTLDLLEKTTITHDLTDNSYINYNGFRYKLDYIIQSSTDNYSNGSCGHAICAITYKNEEYIYDSGIRDVDTKCGEDDIIIPCSLIKYKWKNALKENINFCVNSCLHKKTTETSQSVYKNTLTENKLCFNNLSNIILAYIKVDVSDEITSGGNNNKYKSIHKKINILNKNNKIIERTIYINDNIKTKFIKYNKTFKSLSDFKYNKKNKYYYI